MKLILVWIPGHEGFVGNERADKLAKRGAMSRNLPIQLGLSIKVTRSKIKEWLINKSNHNFRQTLLVQVQGIQRWSLMSFRNLEPRSF